MDDTHKEDPTPLKPLPLWASCGLCLMGMAVVVFAWVPLHGWVEPLMTREATDRNPALAVAALFSTAIPLGALVVLARFIIARATRRSVVILAAVFAGVGMYIGTFAAIILIAPPPPPGTPNVFRQVGLPGSLRILGVFVVFALLIFGGGWWWNPRVLRSVMKPSVTRRG